MNMFYKLLRYYTYVIVIVMEKNKTKQDCIKEVHVKKKLRALY